MVTIETRLKVSDNSDAVSVKAICMLGGTYCNRTRLGRLIIVVIQRRKRTKNLIKRDIQYAIICGLRSNTARFDGVYLRAVSNKVILVKKDLDLIGTRIKGVLPVEMFVHNNLSKTNLMKKVRRII